LGSNIYEDIVFTPFFGSLPPVTLIFDPQKLISTTNPNTSVTKTGWNSLHWFVRYGVHEVFGSLPAVALTFDFLSSKSNQHIYKPIYIYDQNWVKLPSLVCEIWCPSFTHGQTQLQNASGTVFQWCHRHKNSKWKCHCYYNSDFLL